MLVVKHPSQMLRQFFRKLVTVCDRIVIPTLLPHPQLRFHLVCDLRIRVSLLQKLNDRVDRFPSECRIHFPRRCLTHRGRHTENEAQDDCKNCKTKYAKEFIDHTSWFGTKKLEDRPVCILVNLHANVTELDLSHLEISAVTPKQIDVTTTAVDPENDILTYNYTITGGRIIGTGPKVKWDLSAVASGTYTITAGVDDGCGLCGATMTKTVVVK